MAQSPARFGWPRTVAGFLVILTALGAVALVGVGIYGLFTGMAGAKAFIIVGAMSLIFALLVYVAIRVMLKLEATTFRIYDTMLDMSETLHAHGRALNLIAENAQLSDGAKSIAHREKERDALRNAIREDIVKQDWEGAYRLIDEMERRFGYREEAERFREEVDTIRQETIKAKIDQAADHIEELLSQRAWDQAREECARLLRLFPGNERVVRLLKELEDRRDERKRQLLTEWNEAVQKSEIDRGIAILRELDQYLTRSEAAALQDSARGVFKARLTNLGVRFSLAVTERRWRDALETGLQIIDEFPNSRMAQEVRERMDALRRRAGLADAAQVVEQRIPQAPNQSKP